MQEEKKFYTNPITGNNDVEEVLKESEAKERGYLELEFLMKYLEDENEFSKYLIVDGRKILIDMKNPMTQYKKKTIMDYERVLQTNQEKKQNKELSIIPANLVCSIDNAGCESCSG